MTISEEDKKAWSDPNADESAPATDIAALRKIDSFHALIETSIQEKEVIRSNLKQPLLVHPDGHLRLFWDIVSLIMLSFVVSMNERGSQFRHCGASQSTPTEHTPPHTSMHHHPRIPPTFSRAQSTDPDPRQYLHRTRLLSCLFRRTLIFSDGWASLLWTV